MEASRLSRQRLATLVVASLIVIFAAACRGEESRDGDSSPTAPAPPAPTVAEPTGTATLDQTATPTATVVAPEPAARIRDLLRSALVPYVDGSEGQAALNSIEVETLQLGTPDRRLWAGVTSGHAIFDLGLPGARHLLGVYEQRPDDSFVEVVRMALESEPIVASLELVRLPTADGYPVWLAVHGFTGAHSGTFELVSFDGTAVASALWWFSPSPDAAMLEDVDGDGIAEVVLNATDPYVFCYACGVSIPSEIIYRWEGGEPTAVNIAPVGTGEVLALSTRAAGAVEGDLWRLAVERALAAEALAPGDPEVRWLRIAIERIAADRLAQAGFETQPLLTNVIAGEYEQAVGLMRDVPPADVFSATGPLVAGTAALNWESTMGDHLVAFTSRAIEAEPALAAAWAVRALGRILVDPTAWSAAHADMAQAVALAPTDSFYGQAAQYLLERSGAAGAGN